MTALVSEDEKIPKEWHELLAVLICMKRSRSSVKIVEE